MTIINIYSFIFNKDDYEIFRDFNFYILLVHMTIINN